MILRHTFGVRLIYFFWVCFAYWGRVWLKWIDDFILMLDSDVHRDGIKSGQSLRFGTRAMKRVLLVIVVAGVILLAGCQSVPQVGKPVIGITSVYRVDNFGADDFWQVGIRARHG